MRLEQRSRWLADATFDGGLRVPGRSRWRTATLHLTADHVELSAGDRSVPFVWDDFASHRRRSSSRASWSIVPWGVGREGPIGVAVEVRGRYAQPTAALRRSVVAWRYGSRRLLRGTSVPLCSTRTSARKVDIDRRLLDLICSLVADRPEVRRHLGDRSRVERLVHDLRSNRFEAPPFRVGFRRTTMEILTAMRSAGLEHRVDGRPLPGDPLPTEDEAVARVLAVLRSNPFARSLGIDDAKVRAVVVRDYLGVEPWPVGALLEP
ncbi:MAG: hypothetical protein KF906_09415 [Actinobacteria bacterium]|nr:hypothetical protein [Actinomycetota bacterium]